MKSALSQHYFEGNYRPVREEVTITELAVTGTSASAPTSAIGGKSFVVNFIAWRSCSGGARV